MWVGINLSWALVEKSPIWTDWGHYVPHRERQKDTCDIILPFYNLMMIMMLLIEEVKMSKSLFILKMKVIINIIT